MPHVDISAIVNAHREGLLVKPTLDSLSQAVQSAREAGLHVQILFVLDRTDELTREMISEFGRSHASDLLEVGHGDLGISRNSGATAAKGEYIAFLDADDLWGKNWLSGAYRAASNDKRQIVWHPELNVYFGANPHLFKHTDMEDPLYNHLKLGVNNQWTALCFARRSLLLEVPYSETRLDLQIGYEDWGWHLATTAKGVLHKVVPGTAHAIRNKEVSLVRQTSAARCLPRSTNLFREILYRKNGQQVVEQEP